MAQKPRATLRHTTGSVALLDILCLLLQHTLSPPSGSFKGMIAYSSLEWNIQFTTVPYSKTSIHEHPHGKRSNFRTLFKFRSNHRETRLTVEGDYVFPDEEGAVFLLQAIHTKHVRMAAVVHQHLGHGRKAKRLDSVSANKYLRPSLSPPH